MWLGEDFNNMIVVALVVATLISIVFLGIAGGLIALIAHFIFKFAKKSRRKD